MKYILLVLLAWISLYGVTAQQPVESDAYPVYNPNSDQDDVLENALPYYYADPLYAYTYCTSATSCERATYQYAFGEGRTPDDNKSNFDVYYSDYWDEELAPAGKPVVLLLPGGSGTRKNERLMLRAISYAQRGYVALVGDYRSAVDSMFTECLDERQGYFAIQTAVVDARAILRRAFYLAQLPESEFKIDPTKIFLDGITWGSLTTYHMTIMDLNEYPVGTVEILGQEYTFTDDLDHIQICEDPDALCNSYLPFEGYEIKDHIKGVAASSIYVLDPALIDADDTAPVIMTHGTCDIFSPFWIREFRFSRYAHHVGNGGNPSVAPCQDDEAYEYLLYGAESMYQRYLELSGSESPDIFMRYFAICGENHTFGDYSITRTCLSVNCIQLNLSEYETIRFYAEILNNINTPNEVFHLDHSLLTTPDGVAQAHCQILPGPDSPIDHPVGTYWAGIENICPTCDGGEQAYNALMRFPYFNVQNGDSGRYPLVENCTTLSDHITLRDKIDVKVYNFMGELILETTTFGNDELRTFLQSGHGLENGFYAIHFSTGLRKAVFIY